jgi:hypothetical protein
MGASPIGACAMTNTDRSRRRRARLRAERPAPARPDPVEPLVALPASLYRQVLLCLAPGKTPPVERYEATFRAFLAVRHVAL